MFKYFLISIVIAPVLLGIGMANGRDQARGRMHLRILWMAYGVVWIGVLYYLRRRWQ